MYRPSKLSDARTYSSQYGTANDATALRPISKAGLVRRDQTWQQLLVRRNWKQLPLYVDLLHLGVVGRIRQWTQGKYTDYSLAIRGKPHVKTCPGVRSCVGAVHCF